MLRHFKLVLSFEVFVMIGWICMAILVSEISGIFGFIIEYWQENFILFEKVSNLFLIYNYLWNKIFFIHNFKN